MKLLILDRDGVINEDSDDYVKSADEWQPLAGSIEAIAKLNRAGFTVVVATNQSGLGRGLFQQSDLDAMHAKLSALLATAGGKLAGIFYCPHTPDECCNCRKPQAGLIDQIEQALGYSAERAFMVGDSLRDLEAGLLKDCQPLLVKTGKGQRTLQKIVSEANNDFHQMPIFADLAAAVPYIIEHSKDATALPRH